MNSSNYNRRQWLKGSMLALGATALIPQEIWSKSVENAQQYQDRFLFKSTSFNEYTPPQLPDLDTLKARLMWNENPYGPSKLAASEFKEKVFDGNHYSWKSLGLLMDKIAEKEGVSKNQIMMGPGSSDLLEKTALVLFKDGGNVVSADPCYMSLIKVAQAVKGDWKAIKLAGDYQHDLNKMESAIDNETKLVYITNPNNPTATLTDPIELKAFCSGVSEKVPVFIDEAYIELSDEGMKNSMVSLVAEGKNVLISRTFSKIHGMAGLRIGYMLGSTKLLEQIQTITRGGMGITGPSIAAALASLNDQEFLTDCRNKLLNARKYTNDFLIQKGIKSMPSQTNFLIFPIAMDGEVFLSKIFERSIGVRAFKFWDQNWCRVSIGKLEEMKLFTEAISEILA